MIYHFNNSCDTVFSHSHVGNPVLYKSPVSSSMFPVGLGSDLEFDILDYSKNSNAFEDNVKMINEPERQYASFIPPERPSCLITSQRRCRHLPTIRKCCFLKKYDSIIHAMRVY